MFSFFHICTLQSAHCALKVLDVKQPYPKAPPVPNERRGSMKRALQKVHWAERFLFWSCWKCPKTLTGQMWRPVDLWAGSRLLSRPFWWVRPITMLPFLTGWNMTPLPKRSDQSSNGLSIHSHWLFFYKTGIWILLRIKSLFCIWCHYQNTYNLWIS